MVRVESVSRWYDDFCAVDDVSFTIAQGEVVGLLGHNGAGKTTIMKMLTGYLQPDKGRITINDLDIVDHPLHVKAGIGYLPENLPLYPEMMVAEYLEYAASLHGIESARRMQAIKVAMSQTGLIEKATQIIGTLSRGYKQRVGVAQAILHQPRVLILDEPTNGLDPTQTQLMRELIGQLSKQSTVILSTHIMQEVDAVCDRVLILRNGRLVVDEHLEVLGETHTLILKTDLKSDDVNKVLDESQAFRLTESISENKYTEYHIQVSVKRDIGDAIAQLSQSIIQSGGRIFAVYPERHNLETVFREVNMGKEADNHV